jgi:hypothetical protein
MSKYTVSRAVNGISLNGREYLLDDDGKVRAFDTVEQVLELLGVDTVEELEAMGINIEEEPCT